MNWRYADGSDKIAAFERGMSDEQAALAFETSGVLACIIEETFLVAYTINDTVVVELLRQRLYDGPGTNSDVQDFLESEAGVFEALDVASFGR